MPAIWRGQNPPLVHNKTETDTTSAGGVITRTFWEGREAEVKAKQLGLIAAGWATSLTHEGPLYKLTATIGGESGGDGEVGGGGEGEVETPAEFWSWHTENLTRDIWTFPPLARDADKYDKEINRIGAFKELVEYAVENQKPINLGAPNYPSAPNAVRAIARGTTGYETEYFVLTRTRNYSPAYPFRYPMNANGWVFTYEQLYAVFDVPSVVRSALPVIPAAWPAPEQMMWGWRIRDFSSEYDGQNRITERVALVFALWDVWLYRPFSA